MFRNQGKRISDGMGFSVGMDVSKAALNMLVNATDCNVHAGRIAILPEEIAARIANIGVQKDHVCT